MKYKRTEGGSGGRRGHSNMSHWSKTEEIKKEMRRARRHLDRLESLVDPEDCGGNCHCMLHDKGC